MQELAQAAGISVPYLNKLELGYSRNVSVENFRGLRTGLGLERHESVYIQARPRPTKQGDAA